eukprot:14826217-Alexandrium_andersonii.AAC.1
MERCHSRGAGTSTGPLGRLAGTEEVADSLEWAAIQAAIAEAALAAHGRQRDVAPAAAGAPILRSLQAASRPLPAAGPIDVDA